MRHSLLVNSSSSANLIAISALTSPKLPEARRIQHSDEVITVAAVFPTTVVRIVSWYRQVHEGQALVFELCKADLMSYEEKSTS